jgi:ribonucleotide reductase beta subunit family protein with ferritin-like domain
MSSKEKKSLVNLNNKVDFTKEPIFFGEPLNLERYDKFKYPVYFNLLQQQLEKFWRPEEVDITKDRVDYKTQFKVEEFII